MRRPTPATAVLLAPLLAGCTGSDPVDPAPDGDQTSAAASELTPCPEQPATAAAGPQLLGVISKDGLPQAAAFAQDAGVTFPSAHDASGGLMAELGINALPFTCLMDADGALVHTEAGPVASAEELRALVGEHLGVRL